jgi:hypothetical protein
MFYNCSEFDSMYCMHKTIFMLRHGSTWQNIDQRDTFLK